MLLKVLRAHRLPKDLVEMQVLIRGSGMRGKSLYFNQVPSDIDSAGSHLTCLEQGSLTLDLQRILESRVSVNLRDKILVYASLSLLISN